MPAAASKVGIQSMLISTCSVVRPAGYAPGQRMIAGMRKPPSSSSVLLPGEGPGVGEALAAVVAGEDHDGVVGDAVGLERLQDAADLQVHLHDHARVSALRPAVEMEQRGEPLRLGLVVRAPPRANVAR